MFKWFVGLSRGIKMYHELGPKLSNIPGAIPTIHDLPYWTSLSINVADDCIYRNVENVIVRYIPEKPKCAVLTLVKESK